MYRVLLLDDEANILSALRRCLHASRNDAVAPEMILECFTSAAAAFERLEEEDFDIVISDFRMPEMDGVKFLLRSIESNPSATRILMTAYADLNSVIAAINEAHIACFITKPWNDNDVRATISGVLKRRSQATSGERQTMDAKRVAQSRIEEECPEIIELDLDEDGRICLEQ